MPVAKLFVEGDLDVSLLTALFAGRPNAPIVERRGSKYALPPQVRTEREQTKHANIFYIRDRDFDFEPPPDVSRPTEQKDGDGRILGWRWCRHEIENYLIDVRLVVAATDWTMTEYCDQLIAAAQHIRFYQIARWVVGTARRDLPPNYELRTRPRELNELELPESVQSTSMNTWAKQEAQAFHVRAKNSLMGKAIDASWRDRAKVVSQALLRDVANILVWCSGKDLLAAMGLWLTERGFPTAGDFRARMRDFVREHPEQSLNYLPEWNAFVELVLA